MRNAPQAPPPPPPRDPDGICHHCGAAAVPFGRYCPACYGAVLHPEGRPLLPGDPDDPHRSFNAEADADLADQQMPRRDCIGTIIERLACRRRRRMINDKKGTPSMINFARQQWINRYQQQTGLDVLHLDALEEDQMEWEEFVRQNLDRWERHSYDVLMALREDVPEMKGLAALR